MEYTLSRYTHIFKTSKGDHLAYISRTNALIKIEEELFVILTNLKDKSFEKNSIPEDAWETLTRLKIVTTKEEEEDYLRNLQMRSLMETFSLDKLILVVAPTSSCNFSCPYCFEKTKTNHFMSDEIIDNFIEFVNRFELAKYIHFTWYGGEPLMALPIIEKILGKLDTKFKEGKIGYHGIITNGYNVTPKMIELFKKYPLNEIQITLDGRKERHNQTRKLKATGGDTYDKIIENIGILLNEFDNTKFSIRVNIDRNNSSDFVMVRDMLTNKWPNEKRLSIYPGIIRIEDPIKKCMACNAMKHDDIRELFYSMKDSVRFYPQLREKGCGATHLNSYIVGPLGEIYKCWNDMSNESKIIGYINQDKFTNQALFNKYVLSCDCFKDPKCLSCFYLPICIGGCAWYKLVNIFDNGHYDLCTLYNGDGVLEKCLELHYYSNNSSV